MKTFKEEISVIPIAGSDIYDFAEEVCAFSRARDCIVKANFNEVALCIWPHSLPSEIMETYYDAVRATISPPAKSETGEEK